MGCTVAELCQRLTWQEWIEWQAWWALEPWGDHRQDLRQAAGLSYQLVPYLAADRPIPNLTWPYWDTEDEGLDIDAMRAAAEEEARRWAEWERTRPRGAVGRIANPSGAVGRIGNPSYAPVSRETGRETAPGCDTGEGKGS